MIGILTIPLKGLCLLYCSSPLTSELFSRQKSSLVLEVIRGLHNSQEIVGFIFAYFIPQPRLRSYKPDQYSTLKQGELRHGAVCIVMGYDVCCSVTPIFFVMDNFKAA